MPRPLTASPGTTCTQRPSVKCGEGPDEKKTFSMTKNTDKMLVDLKESCFSEKKRAGFYKVTIFLGG